MTSFARTDRSVLSQWWWTVDRWSVVAITCLVTIGAIMSLAASPAIAERLDQPIFHFVYRNLVFLVPSIGILFVVSLLTPRLVRRVALVVFIVSIILMIATLFIGPEVKGARRWIKFGSFSLQASEFMKPAFVVLTAWFFAENSRQKGFPGNLIAFILFGVVVALLLRQPDFGQTMLLAMVWGTMFFLSGVPLPWVVALGMGAVGGAFGAYSFMPHVASRVNRYLNPDTGDTYQIDRALDAFRAGGLTGAGPGEGRVKEYIPDAHTDFIFAVVAEEFGLVACLVLLVIFSFVVLRSFVRLLRETDLFVQLAGSGLVSIFGYQALINMGVSLNLLPAKGMTLPFVSYGGSSLLATALTVGMLLALTRSRPSGSSYGEIVRRK